MDYWTDRKGFQLRRLCMGDLTGERIAKGVPEELAFPDAIAGGDVLANQFKEISALSFNGDVKDGFRFWMGWGFGSYHGVITAKPLTPATGWHFPPLGVTSDVWGHKDSWSPFDIFFAKPLEQMSLDGTESVNGRKTYKLVHVESGPPYRFLAIDQEKRFPNAKAYHRQIAYVDISQGYLPLRISYESVLVLQPGQKPFSAGYEPEEVLHVRRIEPVKGGGCYPVDYRLERYVDKLSVDELAARIKDREGAMLGKYNKYKNKCIRSEKIWTFSKVDAAWKTRPGMFDMPFPNNTVVTDQRFPL